MIKRTIPAFGLTVIIIILMTTCGLTPLANQGMLLLKLSSEPLLTVKTIEPGLSMEPAYYDVYGTGPGAVFKQLGTSPLVSQPVKGPYSRHDLMRSARLYGIDFNIPDPFPVHTVAACRAYYWVQDSAGDERAKQLAQALYRGYFIDNRNVGDAEVVVKTAAELGLDGEAVAAALQDRDRAVIIGTASFGKGSVQTVLRLPNDGEITLTWSRLVAPSGYMFHGLGVRPSICTSGIKGNAQSIIDQTLNNRIKIEDMLAAWRKPDMQNQDQRTQLRNSCPSQRRRDDLELKIARRLIAQPTQFARALDLTAATHQARNPK